MKIPHQEAWGKYDRDDGAWHPLVDHCADVAAVTEALLSRTLLGRRLARVAAFEMLDEVQIARLAFLAALHDLGKFQLGFQRQFDPAGGSRERGHVGPALDLLHLRGAHEDHPAIVRFLTDCLPMEMGGWAEEDDLGGHSMFFLLAATFCHHGTPQLPSPRVRGDWTPRDGVDPLAGVARLAERARGWFPRAFEDAAPFPATPSFQHVWNGILNLADWIGSHRDFFPFSGGDAGDRMDFARPRAVELLARMGLDADGARGNLADRSFSVVDLLPPEKTRGRTIRNRPLQAGILELPAERGPSVTVLEAPTGEGKTEAALLRFLKLFRAGEVEGLYFALPTRTSAMQIYRRILEATKLVFPEGARPPVVQAVPGYLVVDGAEGVPLPGYEVRWPDDQAEQLAVRGWASESSKRFLAGSIVVGTVDQVLLSALAVRHGHLRSAALLRHLLVVDEVHASDRYMTRILQEVLRHHLLAGGHALLMSATLGSAARNRLLHADGSAGAQSLDDAEAVEYPCLVHRQGQDIAPARQVEADPDRACRVEVELAACLDQPERVAQRAREAAATGARVLVIRNTVAAAVATQRELESQLSQSGREHLAWGVAHAGAPKTLIATCHHSRFARPDRLRLDQAIEEAFAPGRREPKGQVAVATQTVQQSLDLDADLLITDLCPMDVLLQRVGRLHRDHRTGPRPAGAETPRVVVLVPEDRDLSAVISADGTALGRHGLGSVYRDLRVLECTWRLLESRRRLNLPADCRVLVEKTTHPDALAVLGEDLGDEAWRRHFQKVTGQRLSEEQLARLALMPWTENFGEFTLPDLEAAIRTRLGDEDLRVPFDRPIRSPFGESFDELQIPAHLFPKLDASRLDEPAEILEEAEDRLRFRFLAKNFLYDRLGLRAAEDHDPNGTPDGTPNGNGDPVHGP